MRVEHDCPPKVSYFSVLAWLKRLIIVFCSPSEILFTKYNSCNDLVSLYCCVLRNDLPLIGVVVFEIALDVVLVPFLLPALEGR